VDREKRYRFLKEKMDHPLLDLEYLRCGVIVIVILIVGGFKLLQMIDIL